MKAGITRRSARSAISAAPTGVKAGRPKKRHPDAVDLGVLVDQHAERAARAQRAQELARPAPALPRAMVGGAEARAQADQRALQAGLVELARDHRHAEPAALMRRGEQLPVAAVAGEDEDRPARRRAPLDLLPALDSHAARELFAAPRRSR